MYCPVNPTAPRYDVPVARVLLFANPIAGRGRGIDIARRLRQCLQHGGFEVYAFTDPADGIDLSEMVFATSARAAIIVGGDGTVRAAAQKLWDHRQACGRFPPLLIVPLGTANLMGRHLGIAWQHEIIETQILSALSHGQVVHLDAAVANGRLFLLMAGVGLDAAVVHELSRLRRGPISIASYLLPVARAILSYDYPPLRVQVDGRCVWDDGPALAWVGNAREYGTGFAILPHARSDDGVLDVCVLPCESRGQMIRLALAAAAGEHLHEERVLYMKGRSIRIDSPQPVPVQLDGEPAGFTPVSIQLLAEKLPFIVPAAT